MTSAKPAVCANDWSVREGTPTPLGITYVPAESSYNFSLYSKHATAVTLLLFDEGDLVHPTYSYSLRFPSNKTGRVWHCRIPATVVERAKYYAYRVDGPHQPAEGHRFDPEKILLDPYAHAVYFPPEHSRAAACVPGANAGKAPLGVVHRSPNHFDWGRDVRPRHTHDTIIYEMHVRGFTKRANSGVPAERRGTYAGVIDKIPYLTDLGVTVVELMPVQQFDPSEGNYWGYMPLNLFSPHHQYAGSKLPGEQILEFKSMVRALHDAGIEVMLDVVYNHTAEADERGPNYSYRGIDNTSYYLLEADRSRYRNDAGCGNVLHCANRYVRKMVMDSLRFWVEEMHVDGFRFDLASIFTRRSDGGIDLEDPPVIAEISGDPTFEGVRLVAEAWDLATYQLGRDFPGMTWLQWNGKFRDDLRRWIKSDTGMVGAVMQRIYGSNDLFPDELALGYRPFQSVNYVCSHDGFSMRDLVSYNRKHNEANGCNNTDGMDANHSWNCGWEGDEGAPQDVLLLRERQVKNLCTLLMLANGTPMFMAGDEFMNTQRGNNNPWNQDNEITWLDWDLTERYAGVHRFWKRMIEFRKAHPSLGRSTFWRDDVRWYGAERDVDFSSESRSVAFCLGGAAVGDTDIYVMVNAWWEPLEFTIQEGEARNWKRVVDTSLASPADATEGVPLESLRYRAGARSVAVFVRV